MNSTSSTLQSLWRYLDTRRGDEYTNPWKALLALARGEIPGELTPDVIEAVIGRAASRGAGEFVTPPMVSRFMADLASITKPYSVLDPTCGSGLMLQQVIAAHKPGVAVGIDLNHDSCEIAAALLNDQAAITHGNALDATLKLQDAYDLIIADPPLGGRVHPGELPPSLKDLRLRDLAQYIVVWACHKLAPKGALAIVMSPVALQHQPFVDAIHAAGCRMRASLHVPSGTRLHTGIASQVLVIDHGSQQDIFVGQLSDDPEHGKRLLQNFKRHRTDRHPSLGRTLPLDQFIGFEALEAKYLLRQRVRQTSLVPIPFTELVKEESRQDREALAQNADSIPANVLLLSQSNIRFTTDISKIPSRDRTCTCFVLDESKTHASYLMRWFDKDIGKLALQAVRVSSWIGAQHISRKVLERLICYLPPLKAQHDVLEALRHLERLRSEAQEIEAQCWTGHHSSEEILQRAQTINQEDRYEDWLSTLPYPLASILWRHRVSGDDPRIRFRVLLHFFEALAEFLATVHLSAFSSHAIIWQEAHGKLLKALAAKNLTFERATFGAWKVVVENLSALTRDMLAKEDYAPVAIGLYAATTTSWMKKLCAPKISQMLARANGIRNTHNGHGGAMGKAQAESLEDDLRDLVEELRSLWGRGWNQYELLQIDKMAYSDGQFTFESPRIMGANSQFERVSRATTAPMDFEQLYLLAEGAPKGLKLLPLVRVMASPSQVANACYFYNRSESGGQRFVSYHFEQESEVCQHFEDTAMVLQQLTMPPEYPAAEVNP